MSDKENTNEIQAVSDGSDSAEEGRIYELGYLLKPSFTPENAPAEHTKLRDLITSLGGVVIADELPRELTLAYTMSKVTQNVRSKFNNAYFSWIKFEMDPAQVTELKKKLDLEQNLIRFLIMKTVRENTIATKRFAQKDFRKKIAPSAKESESETSLPINKEEIDKEIDAMVAV